VSTNTPEDKDSVSPESAKSKHRFKALPGASRKVVRKLTPAQKAEAVALWRTGEVTLEDLASRFGKRRETFSRLFTEMGIKKGEAALEHQEKVAAEVEAKILTDANEMALKIARVKDEHFRMADALGKLVWQEIVIAKREKLPIHTLRGTMHTLQMASSTLANVRSELYKILQVEKFDEAEEDNDLPELQVTELSQEDIVELQKEGKAGAELDELDVEELPELSVENTPKTPDVSPT
jgi:transposase-like protein